MSESEGEGKKLPEWSIFDRLDELEDITLDLMGKADRVEPSLETINDSVQDTVLMAKYGIWLTFLLASKDNTKYVELKDAILKQLRDIGVGEQPLQSLSNSLNSACDAIKEKTTKA